MTTDMLPFVSQSRPFLIHDLAPDFWQVDMKQEILTLLKPMSLVSGLVGFVLLILYFCVYVFCFCFTDDCLCLFMWTHYRLSLFSCGHSIVCLSYPLDTLSCPDTEMRNGKTGSYDFSTPSLDNWISKENTDVNM